MADLMETIGAPMMAETMNDLHCTVVYSRKTPVGLEVPEPNQMFEAALDGAQFWPGHDNAGCLVVAVNSAPLLKLHQHYLACGCEHSFAEYNPHMTLQTGMSRAEGEALATALNQIIPSWVRVKLVGPYTYNINETWTAGN